MAENSKSIQRQFRVPKELDAEVLALFPEEEKVARMYLPVIRAGVHVLQQSGVPEPDDAADDEASEPVEPEVVEVMDESGELVRLPVEAGVLPVAAWSALHGQLTAKDDQLAAKDQQIATKDQQIAVKDDQLAAKDGQLAEKDNQIGKLMEDNASVRAQLDHERDRSWLDKLLGRNQ